MDIIKKRAQAVTRLDELQKVKPKVYTASELHPRQKQMLARVGRKEEQRFQQRVQKRKLKLKKDISDIDRYLQSVETGDEFPEVLPAPTIVFGPRPIMRQTRIKRHKRGGRH